MTLIQLVINGGFVSGLMVLGHWLESINGVNGWADRCLTPFPMGGGGLSIAFVEWYFFA